MDIGRIVRHLGLPGWAVSRAFPPAALQAIEAAIRTGEARHRGQVRFVVEGTLDGAPLWHGQTACARARELFGLLGVWDTAENNGVLIYLLLADRDVEIVADRGVHAVVGAEGWETICRRMEAAFREGRYEAGALDGLQAVNDHLVRTFPATGASRANELPDQPLVLR